MYYVGTIDRLLGETVRYGTVYQTLTSAKKALSSCVRESRKEASKHGYGRVYSHWSKDRQYCELTFGKDPCSTRWDLLAIKECEPGIWYDEVIK